MLAHPPGHLTAAGKQLLSRVRDRRGSHGEPAVTFMLQLLAPAGLIRAGPAARAGRRDHYLQLQQKWAIMEA